MNGWYDYQFSELKENKQILRMKNLYWYDRFIKREGSDIEVNARVLIAMKKLLDQLEAKKLDVILTTHFVPKKTLLSIKTLHTNAGTT